MEEKGKTGGASYLFRATSCVGEPQVSNFGHIVAFYLYLGECIQEHEGEGPSYVHRLGQLSG